MMGVAIDPTALLRILTGGAPFFVMGGAILSRGRTEGRRGRKVERGKHGRNTEEL